MGRFPVRLDCSSAKLSSPDAARSRFEAIVAALGLAWCTFRLARGIGPEPFYNSDCAVPILLMQGLAQGPFALFYPRQDRYGMWPFLVARWLHLGTPEAFHAYSVLVFCSTAIPLWRVLGSPVLAVVALLAPVALNRVVAWNTFQAGQPYLWQLVTLCWAWWGCRVALLGSTPGKRVAAAAGFFLAGALSAWINPMSLVALLGVLVLEAVRARARPVRIAGPVVALGLATLAEAQLRRWYNTYCRRVFGERFISALRLDRGHLLGNVGAVAAVAWREGMVIPLLLGVAALPLPGWTRSRRFDQAALVWMAACTLPALALIQYFRTNDFANRYFSFAAFWAIAAATFGVLTVLSGLVGSRGWAVRAVALAALVLAFPSSPPDPLAAQRAAAAHLLGPEPRVLLGWYWHVYVPASLAPGRLLPLPQEKDYSRFPDMQAELQPGRAILVDCNMDAPDGTVRQYGAVLRRTADPPIAADGKSWCPHAVEQPSRPFRERRLP